MPSVLTSDLAEVDFALFFWLRNAGMAIAARMPMMIMTTSSSMSVKPLSLFSALLRMRASMVVSSWDVG